MDTSAKDGRVLAVLFFTLLIFATSCGVPRYDCSSLEGKAAVVDEANKNLTSGNCTDAISAIDACYNSVYSDSEVRMIRAAAYGCKAGINYFELVGNLAANNLTGTGFWKTMAKLFPSTTSDTKTEAAQYAMDALLAVLNPGAVVASAYQINSTSNNPGSVVVTDRTDSSTGYLMFVSMAAIGSLENRYSAPNSVTYVKTQVLGYTAAKAAGWADVTNMDAYGCTYAASVLNLIDSINQAGTFVSGALGSTLRSLGTTLKTNINLACEAGCSGAYTATTQCAGIAAQTCTPCPKTLRNREACVMGGASAKSDSVACSAAGIINFINTDATNGWN